MSESDGTVEVLKQIRDELRNVRGELAEKRNARTGVRTERVARQAWLARWPLFAIAGTGAVALVALVLAVRAGGPAAAPTVVSAPPVVASAPAAPAVAPAPPARPAPAPAASPLAAAKPPAARPAARVVLSTVPPAAPKPRVTPEAAGPKAAAASSDDDETMAFSPPAPRRVRVHKMSYDSPGSEPTKL